MPEEKLKIGNSSTSDRGFTQGKQCVLGKFISELDGWKIIDAAREWEGTPYRLWGSGSKKQIGGDCSGTTNMSFIAAGFPYPYQSTGAFAAYARKSLRFRLIDPDKKVLQAGDVLLWNGHMAIYAPFIVGDPRRDTGVIRRGLKMKNIMYTAFNSHSDIPYGPYNIETFRGDAFSVYRYLIMPGLESCPS